MRDPSRRNPLDWLFKATFSGKDVAAPLPSPLLCDVGTLTITDTENKLSISGGELVCAGGKATPGWGDPQVADVTSRDNTSGMAILVTVSKPAVNTHGPVVGFENALFFNNSAMLCSMLGTSTKALLMSYSSDTDYDLVVVCQSFGALLICDSKLLYATNFVGSWPYAPRIANYNAAFTADNLRVIDLGGAWASDYGIARAYVASPGAITPTLGTEIVLTPLFDSDTNWSRGAGWAIAGGTANATTATSNLQETGGTACVIGNWYQYGFEIVSRSAGAIHLYLDGVVGQTNLSAVQTYLFANRSSNTDRLYIQGTDGFTGSVDNATRKLITLSSTLGSVYDKHADYLAEVAVTLTAGTQAGLALNLDDETNPQNFVICYHDGVNAHMDKCVGGTYTSLIDTAATYSAGKRLVVIKDGTSITLYYNEAKIGATQTVTDAGIKDNTKHTWFSTYSGNTFSNFVIWPRTVTLPQGV